MSEYDVTCCEPSAVVEEKHHPYGPSRWPALAVCGHWAGKPGGADAERGTALHALFARAAKGELGAEDEEKAADVFERNAIALGRKVLEMAGGNPDKVMVEESVTCPAPRGVEDEFEEGEVFGRADVAWFEGKGRLHVADLKMVANPDRDYRPQLVPYAYGLSMEWDSEGPVTLHTLYVDTMEVTEDSMEWEELEKAYGHLWQKVHAVSRGVAGTPVQSGWCQLCANYESCPACREVAQSVAPGGRLADAPKRWPDFTSQQKAQLCVVAEQVGKWADAIKKRAGDDAKAGEAIEDPENGIFFGLQERKGPLTLDTDRAWEMVKSKAKSKDIPQEKLRAQFVSCLKLDAAKFKGLLQGVAWMSAKDATAAMEECGTRGPSSKAFVRKPVK